jgi:2-polyprenylphenol hydroxylase and related flavodoxin oxidoreductases
MSSYNIALNFEDGVTRFVHARRARKVLDAAFRAKINLPMDCSDGVCGTCKCRAESGSYDLGDDYIDDALSEDEKESGLVLTCQMVPESDCVIAVPASSTACKTEQSKFAATVQGRSAQRCGHRARTGCGGDSAGIPAGPVCQHRRSWQRSASFIFFFVGTGRIENQFSDQENFWRRDEHWLESAQAGNKVELTGPLGSFYLRAVERPLLFLAGGTGLAPFLSMLEVLARTNSQQKVHLIYGVTRDLDLVQVDAIEAYVAKLPNFTYSTVVADTESTHPRKGWVTQHMPAEAVNDGDVDVYLCGRRRWSMPCASISTTTA